MKYFTSSIRARFTLYLVGFVAVVVGLASAGVLALTAVDLKTEELDTKWLAGSAMVGDIRDHIAHYRIEEGSLAPGSTPQALAEAERLAGEHRRAIQELQIAYTALLGNQTPGAQMASFRYAWHAYDAERVSRVRDSTDGAPGDPGRYDKSMLQLFTATDAAVDALVAAHLSAAHTQAVAADELTDRSIGVAIAVSAVAMLLGMWIQLRIRSQITQPLEAITRALTVLAGGSREVQVPELHRSDEIGAMANAFEVFRTNALALERAHDATRAAQELARSVARRDPLTGLPNRRVFSAELQATLDGEGRSMATHSILLIGLDRFKRVNELEGHAVGDLVLCEIARRLERIVPRGSTVARLGGDEFAIVFRESSQRPTYTDSDTAMELAAVALNAIRTPLFAGGGRVDIGASIGIAHKSTDASDLTTLLHAADVAMYRAKRDGGNTIRIFEQSMDDDVRAQGALEADLKMAVIEGQIRPNYQPLVEFRSNRICGFEALARWEHPRRGFVAPDQFIPIIERLGLMAQFTASILRQVCRDAKTWPAEIRVAVNISTSALKNPQFPNSILAIVAQEGFQPSRLEIEITESALVSDIAIAKQSLTTLQNAGVRVSLDDFGTGYASLHQLNLFKFDTLKIDRSFVQSMRKNPDSETIIDAILGLTKNLKLTTIAEGIEDSGIYQLLAAKGCDFGQGYYFGKAMTATHATEMLADRTIIQKRLTTMQAA